MKSGINDDQPADQAKGESVLDDGKGRYSQSFELGAATLGCFSPQRPELGAVEIADKLGIGRAAAHRYVTTLRKLGYLEPATHRRSRLTLSVTKLGMSAMSSLSLAQLARPCLQRLRDRASLTSLVAVLDGDEVVIAEVAHASNLAPFSPEAVLSSGVRLPVHCTASGKALLAHAPAYVKSSLTPVLDLTPCAPKTITVHSILEDHLEIAKKQEIVRENEEYRAAQVSIAAVVRDYAGEVTATVALVAASDGLTVEELVGGFAGQLVAAAGTLSASLGYREVGPL